VEKISKRKSSRILAARNLLSVDILLPIHGKATFLSETLKSIIPELSSRTNLIIVLDRAAPEVVSKVEAFGKTIGSRVRIYFSQEPGIVSALNFGINQSNADLIARIDCDDIMVKGRIVKQREYFSQEPNLVALGGQCFFINENSEPVRPFRSNNPKTHKFIKLQMYFRNPLAHPTVMFRRVKVAQAGYYRSEMTGLEDFDLWARLLTLGDVRNSHEEFIFYRISQNQSSRSIDNQINKHVIIVSTFSNWGAVRIKNFIENSAQIDAYILELNAQSISKATITIVKMFILSPLISTIFVSYRLSSHFKCKIDETFRRSE